MRICGQQRLSDDFKWTPTMLLAMIKEIDKVCPEEGMIYDSNNTQTHNASSGPVQE
jgi:hypothetical protein